MRLFAAIGVLAVIIAIAAGVFFLGGFFNIAATIEDPGVVNWALIRTRTASIQYHASGTPPIKLDDPEVIKAGARAFAQQGCATCHGGPGVDYAKFAEGINPGPPELKDVAGIDPAQLFWVIKNGIRMTGMPSFEKAGASDQDIWQIVAFVKKMPDVSDADYKTWTTQK